MTLKGGRTRMPVPCRYLHGPLRSPGTFMLRTSTGQPRASAALRSSSPHCERADASHREATDGGKAGWSILACETCVEYTLKQHAPTASRRKCSVLRGGIFTGRPTTYDDRLCCRLFTQRRLHHRACASAPFRKTRRSDAASGRRSESAPVMLRRTQSQSPSLDGPGNDPPLHLI